MNKKNFNKIVFGVIAAVCCTGGTYAQSGIITTIAGNGTSGTSGDGGPATAAAISMPVGVTVNAAQEVFIAYYSNFRKISAVTNTISSISIGSSVASAASLWTSSTGDHYITDHWHDNVMKFSASGYRPSRHCGSGHQGYGGDGGPASSASLLIPAASCVDMAGNVYVADAGSNRIRMVSASTGVVTTICNSSTTGGFSGDGLLAINAKINRPNGICVDGNNNLYISDAGNQRIRKINLASGIITTVAGTGTAGFSGDRGPATAAMINSPAGMFADKMGNVYFADMGNNRVRRILNSGTIMTVAGNSRAGFSGDGGPATAAQLNNPSAVWVDDMNDLYIADTYNNRIRKVHGIAIKPSETAMNEVSADFSIFPNPSSGSFVVTADASLAGKTYEIFNIAGKKVHAGTINALENNVEIDQPAGIYILIVDNDGTRLSKRFTIAK